MTFTKTDDVNFVEIQPFAVGNRTATKLGVSVAFDNLTDKAVLNYWLADDIDNITSSQIEITEYKSWDKLPVSTFMIIINSINIQL